MKKEKEGKRAKKEKEGKREKKEKESIVIKFF